MMIDDVRVVGQAPTLPQTQDLRALAAVYAQIVGLVAGFGFAGFTILLTSAIHVANVGQVAATLFSACVTLVIVGVLYGLLSAERALVRQMISAAVYGVPFGVGVLTVFESMTLLALGQPGLREAVWIGRAMTIVLTPTLLLPRLTIATRYLEIFTSSGRRRHLAGFVLTPVILLLGVGLATVDVRPYLGPALPILRSAHVDLITVVVAALVSPWITTRPADYRSRPWLIITLLTTSCLAIVAFMLSASVNLTP